MAPNCKLVVSSLAHDFPQEFKDCHNFSLAGDRPWAFVRRLAWVLHSTVDERFGLNGKRGNVSDPSADAVSFRNPASPAGGVEVIDVVSGAGGPNAAPAWQDVTQATVDAGTVGAYIAPQPVAGQKPGGDPTPPPTSCQWRGCDSKDDIAALFEVVVNLVSVVEQVSATQDTLIAHLDDVKARIERVSQELANKPEAACRFPKWR